MTQHTDGLPEVQTDPKSTGFAYRAGQAIAVVALVGAAAIIGSLTVWGIVAIWRAIL